jgi:hypothetical protein
VNHIKITKESYTRLLHNLKNKNCLQLLAPCQEYKTELFFENAFNSSAKLSLKKRKKLPQFVKLVINSFVNEISHYFVFLEFNEFPDSMITKCKPTLLDKSVVFINVELKSLVLNYLM